MVFVQKVLPDYYTLQIINYKNISEYIFFAVASLTYLVGLLQLLIMRLYIMCVVFGNGMYELRYFNFHISFYQGKRKLFQIVAEKSFCILNSPACKFKCKKKIISSFSASIFAPFGELFREMYFRWFQQ